MTQISVSLHNHEFLQVSWTCNQNIFHNFSCNFKSTLEDIKKGKERDEDPDPIWNGMGYCLCNEVTDR